MVRKLNNSPFRYPGGKYYGRKLILQCIPPHDKYCETFTGGGSIFFSKHSVSVNVLNDLDEELINCYIHIRDRVDDLIELLKDIKVNKELHGYYKNEYKPQNDLERSFRFYYLNRTSYSGIMRRENCYFGYGDKYSMRPENWGNHLKTTSEKLQGVTLCNYDFEKIITELDDDFFLFIDPPYYSSDQDKFYNVIFSHDDHLRLSRVLKENQHRFKFLITYDNSDEVRELYKWCHSLSSKEWYYTLSRTDDQKNGKKLKDGFRNSRNKGQELFITNYDMETISGIPEMKYNQINQNQISLL